MRLALYSRQRLRHNNNSAALVLAYIVSEVGVGIHIRHRNPPLHAGAHPQLECDIYDATSAIRGSGGRGLMPGYGSTAQALAHLKMWCVS